MSVLDSVKAVKKAQSNMAVQTEEQRNRALLEIGRSLEEHREKIYQANREDMEQAKKDGIWKSGLDSNKELFFEVENEAKEKLRKLSLQINEVD